MTSDDPTVIHGAHDAVSYLLCEAVSAPEPAEGADRSWTHRGAAAGDGLLHLAHPGATFTLCGETVGRVGPVLAPELRRSNREMCAACLEEKARHDIRDPVPGA